MAEEVLVGVTGEILKNLISLVTEEINLAWGLKGDLKKLSQKLTMIQAVLHDAERRQVREESVRVWLKNLKGVAYDAEVVLDEFAYEILRRKMEIENRVRSKVRNFFSISNPIAFRFKMARRVKNINSMLAQIAKEADEFKLEKVEPTEGTTNCGEIWQTHPHVDDSRVVGRNVDVQKIVDMLLNSDDEGDLSIVAIVGMAGLGKTTLAQLVYKNEVVTRHFSERMWVCVSHDFDVGRILKEMVESLTRESCDISNIGAMIVKLKEILDQKKCLIVFDDVWNNNSQKWESLRNSLLGIGASRGSKVIVTTRSDEVVSAMPTTSLTYRLIVLSDDDSWILFKQRAFSCGGAKETPNLADIGRRIVKRCNGLPLAITTLGALMHSKKEEHEWLSIENSAIWNLPKGEMEILPVLRLSFDHLPLPYLKQCFAYLSIFSKGFKIEKEDLIQLWMAQGFLQPSQGRDCEMENIGDEYFKNLLWNSLILQDLKMDDWDQETTECMMHDLVHDLAIFVSGSQRLNLSSGEVNDNVEAQPLLLCPNGNSRPTIPKESARKKRSLVLLNLVPTNLLLNLKCLRVLIIGGANIKKLPTSIGKLKHLRYLNITYSAIQAFPESLDELYNLQTLRLMNCSIELPKNLRKLINLRHIYFDGQVRPHQMPIEMGRLTCLQTLPLFFVGLERGRQIQELGCLNKLSGQLRICNLEHVKDEEEAKTANLLEKKNLHKLEFVWNPRRREGDNNDENVLEGLQPPPNLKRLWIENFGGDKFPSWMMRMGCNSCGGLLPHNNLVEVRLKNCYKCEKLPTLGQLPYLSFLVLHGMSSVKCIGPEFYSYEDEGASGNNGGGTRALFPALKRLVLFDLCNLVEWMEARVMPAAGGRVFPCLEKLELLGCPKLTSAPTHFPSLRELTIRDSSYMPLANMSTNLTTLTLLSIKSMSDLTSLPEGLLQNNKNLASLIILQCEKLRYLPDELHTLVSLEKLSIEGCPHLESIPSIHGLTSLRILNIRGCDGLTSLPCGVQSCTFLEILEIVHCPNIQISVVESDLRELRSLSTLSFMHCGKLERLPEGLRCLTRLKSLGIGGFREELDSLPNFEEILQLEQLPQLRLCGWPKLKSLPHQLQHLTALKSLCIIEFDGVEALPEWLGNLSSLEHLFIWKCKTLMYLPPPEAMRRLTKLGVLRIKDCPLLKIRCAKVSGPEWFKISHIRRIEIDSQVISSSDQLQAAGRLILK